MIKMTNIKIEGDIVEAEYTYPHQDKYHRIIKMNVKTGEVIESTGLYGESHARRRLPISTFRV